MADGVRTQFGPAPGNVRAGYGLLGGGVLAVAVLVVAGMSLDWSFDWETSASARRMVAVVVGCLAGLTAIASIAAGVYLLWIWLPGYRLTVGADGIELRWRRRTVLIPWREVESWWTGVPSGFLLGGRTAVLAKPAPHVHDPGAGDRRLVWVRRQQPPAWIVCEPALTDGTVEEITAAFDQFAPGKRGEEPDRPYAEFGASWHGRVMAAMLAAGSVALLVLMVWAFQALGPSREAVVVAAIPLGFAVLFGVTAVRQLLHWGPWYRLRVDDDGIRVHWRGHAVEIPWADVASLDLVAPSARQPRARLVLAKPASHVVDPRDGPRRMLWSRRYKRWVLCNSEYVNGTLDDLRNALVRFPRRRE